MLQKNILHESTSHLFSHLEAARPDPCENRQYVRLIDLHCYAQQLQQTSKHTKTDGSIHSDPKFFDLVLTAYAVRDVYGTTLVLHGSDSRQCIVDRGLAVIPEQ